MARKKKTDTMATTDSAHVPAEVVVDYRGFSAHTKGQPAVRHSFSPMILQPFEEGAHELVIHPGCNVLDGEQFAHFRDKCKDLQEALRNGWITRMRDLPDEFALTDRDSGLIRRTMSPAGLDWIEAKEREGANRERVLEAIRLRRPLARPVAFETRPYSGFRGVDQALARRFTEQPAAT